MCALVALGYVTAGEKDLAIVLLVIAVGINSSTYLGFQVRILNIILETMFPTHSLAGIKNQLC